MLRHFYRRVNVGQWTKRGREGDDGRGDDWGVGGGEDEKGTLNLLCENINFAEHKTNSIEPQAFPLIF